MHYEIYIDVVFFTNLLIDYILQAYRNIVSMHQKSETYTSRCDSRSAFFMWDYLSALLSEVRDFSSGTGAAAWRLCSGNAGDRV